MKKELLVVLIFSMIFLCYCTMVFAQDVITVYKDNPDPNAIQILIDKDKAMRSESPNLYFSKHRSNLIIDRGIGEGFDIWDPTTANFIKPSYCSDLVYAYDWQRVALKDNQVFYVTVNSGKLSLHRSIAGIEDRDFLAVSYRGVLIFDPIRDELRVKLTNSSDEVVSEIKTEGGIHSFALSPDMKYMAAGFDGKSILYFCESGEEAATIEESQPIREFQENYMSFSPDSKYYAYITPRLDIHSSGPTTVILIDTSNWKEAARFSNGKSEILSFAFSNDGQYLATGDDKPEIIIWDIASKKAIHRLIPFTKYVGYARDQEIGRYTAVAISPDNRYIVASRLGILEFWNMQNDEFLFLMDRRGEDYIALFPPRDFMLQKEPRSIFIYPQT